MTLKKIYRYAVKGDPRGSEFSENAFMLDAPGPGEEHESLPLGTVSSMILSGTMGHESKESAVEAILDVIGGTYIVLNENTLGIVHEGASYYYQLDVLAGQVLKGGANWKNGPIAFNPRIDRFREATLADFEEYRVSPRGHLIAL